MDAKNFEITINRLTEDVKKLVFDQLKTLMKTENCYDDTHYTSGTIEKVNERMQMVLDFSLLSL